MIKSSFSFISRCLSFLPFLLALVFSLQGAAPFINNALYINYKIFISWVVIPFQSDNKLIDFQHDNQRSFPIFFWAIAGGFLILGIILRRRTTSSRPIEFNQLETTRKTWLHSPAIRILLWISALGAYFVLIGFLCLLGTSGLNENAPVYEKSLSYQGHVYLLSVEPKSFHVEPKPFYEKVCSESDCSIVELKPSQELTPEGTYAGLFKFEVSQCDASGWFCHVIYDGYHTIHVAADIHDEPLGLQAQYVDAHLQADAPHHSLFILYHGWGTSNSGKLLCPIPSS